MRTSACASANAGQPVAGPSVPLLFSPSSIPFESLLKICVWDILPETGLELLCTSSLLVGKQIPPHANDMSACLVKFQRSRPEGLPLDGIMGAELVCFNFLRDVGLVIPVPGSQGHWGFAENAKNHLTVARALVKPRAIMTVRDIPYVDMDLYELYKSLESQGFVCRFCSSSERKEIRKLSYQVGQSDKIWYVEAGKPPSKHYLVSLLYADKHGQSVPALADAPTAQKILVDHGLLKQKPPAKRKCLALACDVAEEDWDVPQPPPKRPRRKPKAKAKAVALQSLQSDADVIPAIEDADEAAPVAGVGSEAVADHDSDQVCDDVSATDADDDVADPAAPDASVGGEQHVLPDEQGVPQSEPTSSEKGADSDSSNSSSSSSSSSSSQPPRLLSVASPTRRTCLEALLGQVGA